MTGSTMTHAAFWYLYDNVSAPNLAILQLSTRQRPCLCTQPLQHVRMRLSQEAEQRHARPRRRRRLG